MLSLDVRPYAIQLAKVVSICTAEDWVRADERWYMMLLLTKRMDADVDRSQFMSTRFSMSHCANY